MNISMRLWSYDHWNIFFSIGRSCTESTGYTDNNIRCDKIRHPELYYKRHAYLNEIEKNESYKCKPTRLKRGINLYNHDDHDCIDDLVVEKLMIIGDKRYKLTRRGLNIYTQLRKYRYKVYSFKDFSPNMDLVDLRIVTDSIDHGKIEGICGMCNGDWGFRVITYGNSDNIFGECAVCGYEIPVELSNIKRRKERHGIIEDEINLLYNYLG